VSQLTPKRLSRLCYVRLAADPSTLGSTLPDVFCTTSNALQEQGVHLIPCLAPGWPCITTCFVECRVSSCRGFIFLDSDRNGAEYEVALACTRNHKQGIYPRRMWSSLLSTQHEALTLCCEFDRQHVTVPLFAPPLAGTLHIFCRDAVSRAGPRLFTAE